MPDGDILSRRIRPRWRSAFALIRGTHSPDDVGDQFARNAAKFLRDNGGVRGLPTAASLINGVRAGTLSAADASVGACSFERAAGTCDVFLPNVIRRALAAQSTAPISDDEVGAKVVEEIARTELFGPLQAVLQELGAENGGLSPEYLDQCEASIADRAARMGSPLAKDPSGASLRAPRRSSRRRSTNELLDEPLT